MKKKLGVPTPTETEHKRVGQKKASSGFDPNSLSKSELAQRKNELKTMADLARKYMWDSDAQRELQKFGVMTEPNRFYSQLPSIDNIENSFEYRPEFEPKGVWWDDTLFNLDTIREFMNVMQEFADEFNPPKDGNYNDPKGYFWTNPAFSYCDAMSYWCNIRARKPNHIVEIGSGFSTLIAAKALKKNGHGKLTCVEPYPMLFLKENIPDINLIDRFIQDISVEEFDELFEDGDIFFIDSTHVVKSGSDCLWIYLKILPALSRDLYVHVHDIPLPYPFTKVRGIERRINWIEPYLLMGYLLENKRTSVYFSSSITHNLLKEEGDIFMGGKMPTGGASIWFEQKGRKSKGRKFKTSKL